MLGRRGWLPVKIVVYGERRREVSLYLYVWYIAYQGRQSGCLLGAMVEPLCYDFFFALSFDERLSLIFFRFLSVGCCWSSSS